MGLSAETCDALACCLDYPTPRLAEHVLDAARGVAAEAADTPERSGMLAALEALRGWAISTGLAAAEERYTQLFDLKPVATLNVSHHLLGDTYQRGALLAGLAGELNRAGIDHGHDLPDFLPTLLRLLGREAGAEDRCLLVHSVVRPGLMKVAEKLQSSPGPYPALLQELVGFLACEVPAGAEEIPELRKPVEGPACSM
jgi:nitrate reductase assembly molybdenum cofactor insertion protein NarJ